MIDTDLEERIRNFVNIPGEPTEYDFVQVVNFIIAALENIEKNALEVQLDDFAECFTDEQKELYLKLAYKIENATTNKQPLKTVYIPPLNEISEDTAQQLIEACNLNTSVGEFSRMLCDGRTTNLIEHLKPRFLAQYLSRLEGIDISYRVNNTDNQ
jgi:hypothetical protein